MKVSRIQQQVKNKGRYSIYIDDEYKFSLSELALIESGLHIGKELTNEDVKRFEDESVADKLYNRTLGLLARRPRSEWEIKDYLKRHTDDEPLSSKILNKLSKYDYIDDEAFAKGWVESRRLLKNTSKRKLQMELRQKRVPDAIITRILQNDETNEQDVIKQVITKKKTQTRYQDNMKLMQYLSRQGFSYDDIKNALSELDQQ